MRRIGEKHGRAKLTSEDVRHIKALLDMRERLRTELEGLTMQAIAEKFDIHEGHVRRIAAGRNWAHI